MAATIEQIMLGVEARLKTIPGLRTESTQPGTLNPPEAIVGAPPVPNYRLAMNRGSFELGLTVSVYTSAAVSRVGQMLLARLANPTGQMSVVAAIEGDRTLGGLVADCVVVSFRPLGIEEVGVIGYYGGVFELRCLALS